MSALLKLPEVITRTGLSKSNIYRKIDSDGFPRPRRLGPRAVAWLEGDIEGWILSRESA